MDRSSRPASPILLPSVSASMIGFVSGLVSSGKLSGIQFTCENLHRLPSTRKALYLFQKTKNYRILLGGFKGGLGSGLRLGTWTAAFCSMKEFIHSPLSTTVSSELQPWCKSISGGLSGLALALGASVLYRLRPIHSPRRWALGSLVGLMAGGAEDLRDWLAGHSNPSQISSTSIASSKDLSSAVTMAP